MVAPRQPKDCYECKKPIAVRMDHYVASFRIKKDQVRGDWEQRIFYHLKCFLNLRGVKYYLDEL